MVRPARHRFLWLTAWLVAAATGPAAAIQDPALRWQTLATPHFNVHFPDGGEALARRLAGIAEESHGLLTRALATEPSERTELVLVDDVDTANGWTRAYPYNQILLYAHPPEADNELGRYDNYLRELFIHEYTHLLHLDQVAGLPRGLNRVFGKTFLPNNLMPGWYIEGIATLVETEFTGGGRIGSAQYDMLLRTAVLEGTFLDLPQITDTPLTRPRGQVPYLYGSYFLKYVRDRFGFEALVKVHREYAKRLIPFAVNLVARRATGHSFVELYADWKRELTAEVGRTAARVRAAGLIEGRRLTRTSEGHESPRYARDGRRVLYIDSTGRARQNVRVLDLATGRETPLFACEGSCQRVTWGPTGAGVFVAAHDFFGRYRFFRDLFVWTPGTAGLVRVTEGARVREPDLAPDGRQLVYVTNAWGQTQLVLHDLGLGRQRGLPAPDSDVQYASPRFSPDGRQLAYSAWLPTTGQRDIYVRDLATGAERRLTADAALDLDPAWAPDGSTLFFASDRGGISNIHALRLADGARFQVTNVLGGAFEPDVHPAGDRLVYLSYHATGYDLYELPLVPATWRPVGPAGELAGAPPPAPYLPPSYAGPAKPYRAWRSAWPHAWRPTYLFSADGLAELGAEIQGSDALGRHAYATAVSFDLPRQRVGVAASYAYDALPVVLSTSLAHATYDQYAFFSDELFTFDEQAVALALGLSLPLPHPRRAFALSSTFNVRYAVQRGRPRVRHDPAELEPVIPRSGWLVGASFGWAYDDTESYTYSISPERGRSLSMRLSVNHPALGSQFRTVAARLAYTEYVPMPWPGQHVLVLGYNGGVAAGDRGYRPGYALGGLPEQDLLVALLNNEGLSGLFLRGYSPNRFAGLHFHLVNAEYRLPFFNIYRGVDTFPLYARRLTAAFFTDVGTAYRDRFAWDALKVGIGAELRLQLDLFYGQPTHIRLGFARGVMAEGETQVYLVLGPAP